MKQFLATFLLFTSLCNAQVKVASLHPLLTDLARDVGGNRVQVIDLIPPGSDVHHFEPSAQDIGGLKSCAMILASGKKLESYLDKLRDSVGSVPVIEVGNSIPSLKISPDNDVFLLSPENTTGGIDPHWWHSAENMKRAARIVGDELIKADPAGKDTYKANVVATQKKFAALKSWAQQQIAQIPRADRKLVTGHAAFGYFCEEYGFKNIPVLGISRQDEASAVYAAKAIKIIRENSVRAAFPEDQANPKTLKEIIRETGIKLGGDLIADGTSVDGHTFETVLRHNVNAIVSALKP